MQLNMSTRKKIFLIILIIGIILLDIGYFKPCLIAGVYGICFICCAGILHLIKENV